jgi:hypothetical protein
MLNYRWVFLNAGFHLFFAKQRHAAQEKPTRQRQINHPGQGLVTWNHHPRVLLGKETKKIRKTVRNRSSF